MLTYNMDVIPESVWKRTTPAKQELAQPYYCTEAGVFYAQQHFSTARTDKGKLYPVLYPPGRSGSLSRGAMWCSAQQALLLNCRTPQSYCTAPGQSCWHHYCIWTAQGRRRSLLLLPGKLTPVQLTGVKMHGNILKCFWGGWSAAPWTAWCTPGWLHEMLAHVHRAFLRKLKPPAHGRSFCRQWRPCAKITSRNFALPTCWQRRT